MSALALEVPMPQQRLLVYLRGLLYNRMWWKSNANAAWQWPVKYLLIVIGAVDFGHGLIVNALVTLAWDGAAFVVNVRIWCKQRSSLATCGSRNTTVWALSQAKNQGLVLLLCSGFGIPMPATKLLLIPEGFLMNPVMFWLNDQFVFGRRLDCFIVKQKLSLTVIGLLAWQAVTRTELA